MITIQVDTKATTRYLDDVQKKRIPIATQRALLKTAQAVKDAELVEMGRAFDRPTRWTLGSMKVKATTKFEVAVGILDPDGYYKRANYYLGTQIDGGARKVKAFERALQRMGVMPGGWMAVPGEKAKLDSYGNQSAGEIKQVLSWFNAAEPTAGSTQNMTQATRDRRRKGTKKKRGFEFFAVIPGSRGAKNLRPGIYRRTSFGFGKAIEPIMIFIKSAGYQKRFNFRKVAETVVDKVFDSHFRTAFQRDVIGGGQ
ncbi:MAG: hypothetical protein M0Q15_15670 [Nevskia sp.]|jgi:hypothetical protein|nr:hypothetical protein [Nevskia sp.]